MRYVVVTLLAAFLFGCGGSLTGLDDLARELPLPEAQMNSGTSARRVAAIDTALLAVPTPIRVGDTLQLSMPVASGGCLGSDTTVVTITHLSATIVPYQKLPTSPTIVCPAIYFVDRRSVRVTFAERGEARRGACTNRESQWIGAAVARDQKFSHRGVSPGLVRGTRSITGP